MSVVKSQMLPVRATPLERRDVLHIPFVIRTPKAEDHLGLVAAQARKFAKDGEHVEGTEQYADGMIGLLKAVERYKYHIGAFSTYAHTYIEKEIIKGHRYRSRKKRNVPVVPNEELDLVVSKTQDTPLPTELLDLLLVDHPDDTDDDKKDRNVLKQHFLEGKTWVDIGKELNVTRSVAQFFGLRAIKTIRKRFADQIEIAKNE